MRTLVKCFWIFILGSFIGCIIEHIWCFIKNKCFQIRRSLIYGPLIPIYGFAALFIILIGDNVGYSIGKMFLIGFLVSTAIEYFFSYAQEKIFHTKSWDYSNFKFNLNGRVNLIYSLGFGLISSIAVLPIKKFSLIIDSCSNHNILYIITFFVLCFFIFDVVLSFLACYRQRKRKEGVIAANDFEKFLDKKYSDERLDKIYNNSVFIA